MQWIESQATSGGGSQKSNRITLLRDADGDGVPETRSVFLAQRNLPPGPTARALCCYWRPRCRRLRRHAAAPRHCSWIELR